MTMPGFTAEASLYKTSNNHYRLASNLAVAGSGDGVTPQAGQPDCNPGCICFSPFDCPCCSVFPFPIDLPNALRLSRIGLRQRFLR
jgi:hypothetical protein